MSETHARLKWIRAHAPQTYKRLQDKAAWEHMSLMAVLDDWPNYYADAMVEVERAVRSAPKTPPPMTADERAEFEAWAKGRYDIRRRDDTGEYRFNSTIYASDAWQAALRSPRIAAAVALADAELAWRDDPREGRWQALLDATERYREVKERERKATGR